MENIFVGNLDFAVTESSIPASFGPYGNIESVNLVADRDTGRSCSFAFVEIAKAAQANRAITGLNGRKVQHHLLNVKGRP